MVVVSHDREFLDQLCTKIVETEHGLATTYRGNYTQFVAAKAEKAAAQWAAWEKQQKEIARQARALPCPGMHAILGRAGAGACGAERLLGCEPVQGGRTRIFPTAGCASGEAQAPRAAARGPSTSPHGAVQACCAWPGAAATVCEVGVRPEARGGAACWCLSRPAPLHPACLGLQGTERLSPIAAARAQTDMIARLAGGAQSGRAAAAEKALDKIKGEGGLVPKPYVPKRRTFAFPPVERMGQRVLSVRGMTHGYQARRLFNNVDLEIGKGERVAIIGARPGRGWQRARAAASRAGPGGAVLARCQVFHARPSCGNPSPACVGAQAVPHCNQVSSCAPGPAFTAQAQGARASASDHACMPEGRSCGCIGLLSWQPTQLLHHVSTAPRAPIRNRARRRVGPNGCGKSTLLRLVMGRETPIHGSVELGEHAILPNYFEQNQVGSFSLDSPSPILSSQMGAPVWQGREASSGSCCTGQHAGSPASMLARDQAPAFYFTPYHVPNCRTLSTYVHGELASLPLTWLLV